MASDKDGTSRPDGTVHVAVVDSETTGLHPGSDEVIGLGVLCVRVDLKQGQVRGVVGSAFEWQEPVSGLEAAQAAARVPWPHLIGRRFDRARIESLLLQTDLVVAHNAALARAVLVPLFPMIIKLPLACSLTDIDWKGQNVLHPSIAALLEAYAMGPTDKTPEGKCHALTRILSSPLPASPETGFHRLIATSIRRPWAAALRERNDRSGLEALSPSVGAAFG
jgi:DNA polymerase III subunit epsilon